MTSNSYRSERRSFLPSNVDGRTDNDYSDSDRFCDESEDEVSALDSSRDENENSESGLELEPMISPSTRKPSRTNSGSLLYTRGTTNRTNSNSSNTATHNRICSSRGQTIVRAAYTRYWSGREQSPSLNSRRPFLRSIFRTMMSCVSFVATSRNRWQFAIVCFAGVILLSVAVNMWEGLYASKFLADSGTIVKQTPFTVEREKGERPILTSTFMPSIPVDRNAQNPHSPSTQKQIHGRPLADAPVIQLSARDYQESLRNIPNESSSNRNSNSFTTWLDFSLNETYPTKMKYQLTNGSQFVNKWCDQTGTSWYPTPQSVGRGGVSHSHTGTTNTKSLSNQGNSNMWQLRAPAFLIPGAAYSGTVYIAAALHRHPSVVRARTKELQFFHETPFQRFVDASGKTRILSARQKMHSRDFNAAALKKNESLVSFDATPGYLFYSSQLPQRILCVEPWVKLVVLLRNPVDRVLEHHFAMAKRGLRLTLEEWIQEEFALMRKVKLIAPSNTTSLDGKFFGSSEEDKAWDMYATSSISGGVGRSMYVIQLRQWIKACIMAGRDPATAILIVRTDRVALDVDGEYARILKFLKLPSHRLQRDDSNQLLLSMPLSITHQTRPVSAATRQLLEDFFLPYNQELKRLIRRYGLTSSTYDDLA